MLRDGAGADGLISFTLQMFFSQIKRPNSHQKKKEFGILKYENNLFEIQVIFRESD